MDSYTVSPKIRNSIATNLVNVFMKSSKKILYYWLHFVLIALFSCLIWLVAYYIPNDGVWFWIGLMGLLLLVVTYLCIAFVLWGIYFVYLKKDNIKTNFCKIGQNMLSSYESIYATMWTQLYSCLERLFTQH